MTATADRYKTRPRPYSLDPILSALGLTHAPDPISQLARRLDIDRRWVRRCRTLGLTEMLADTWATQLGYHPLELWPNWGHADPTDNIAHRPWGTARLSGDDATLTRA